MRFFRMISASVVALAATTAGLRAEPYWPSQARVYFIAPADGAVIHGKVAVKFGLIGAGVAPAGTDAAGVGHHHLLIDTSSPAGEDLARSLPADQQIRHFGGGQTETMLDLPPGRHSLQLIFGDGNHIPHDPPVVSDTIHIEVK